MVNVTQAGHSRFWWALSPTKLAPASETNATLYAQADSAGVVGEPDEDDNIYSTGTDICIATTDAYEGDDNAGTASIISLAQSQTHNFDSLGDQDWIKFDAQVGMTYTLRTSGLGTSADTYLYLYDTDAATLLASNDDYGGTLASLIEWVAPADGTYYILVQHWNPNVGGCGTRYSFTLSEPGFEIFLPLVLR